MKTALADWDTQQVGLWGLLVFGLLLILLSLLYRPPGGDPPADRRDNPNRP